MNVLSAWCQNFELKFVSGKNETNDNLRSFYNSHVKIPKKVTMNYFC